MPNLRLIEEKLKSPICATAGIIKLAVITSSLGRYVVTSNPHNKAPIAPMR